MNSIHLNPDSQLGSVWVYIDELNPDSQLGSFSAPHPHSLSRRQTSRPTFINLGRKKPSDVKPSDVFDPKPAV